MSNNSPKRILLYSVGLICCTVPVISTIILYFPIWRDRSAAAALSGFTLLLILMALAPMFSTVKSILRSPAAYTMWFISFIAFFLLSKIADEMTVISFVGFISNLVGAFFLKAAKRGGRPEGEIHNERQV